MNNLRGNELPGFNRALSRRNIIIMLRRMVRWKGLPTSSFPVSPCSCLSIFWIRNVSKNACLFGPTDKLVAVRLQFLLPPSKRPSRKSRTKNLRMTFSCPDHGGDDCLGVIRPWMAPKNHKVSKLGDAYIVKETCHFGKCEEAHGKWVEC